MAPAAPFLQTSLAGTNIRPGWYIACRY